MQLCFQVSSSLTAIDGLADRATERGSARRPSSKGRERAIASQRTKELINSVLLSLLIFFEHRNCFKGSVGVLRRGGAHMSFSEPLIYHLELNATKGYCALTVSWLHMGFSEGIYTTLDWTELNCVIVTYGLFRGHIYHLELNRTEPHCVTVTRTSAHTLTSESSSGRLSEVGQNVALHASPTLQKFCISPSPHQT